MRRGGDRMDTAFREGNFNERWSEDEAIEINGYNVSSDDSW